MYYAKYRRTDHLFQNHFKSEPVDTQEYLQMVLRYIHQNPVKAQLSKEAFKQLSRLTGISINIVWRAK